MTQKPSLKSPTPRAKQLVRQWANAAGRDTKTDRVGACLSQAFAEQDLYRRDLLLFYARYFNALEGTQARVKGTPLKEFVRAQIESRNIIAFPDRREGSADWAIAFVQTHPRIVGSMAVCRCEDCKRRCFFRARRGQLYCSSRCADRGRTEWRDNYDERRRELRRRERRKSPTAFLVHATKS